MMQVSIRTDGVIQQVGHSLGKLDDCEIVELTKVQEKYVLEAMLVSNGQAVYLNDDGTVQVNIVPDVETAEQKRWWRLWRR